MFALIFVFMLSSLYLAFSISKTNAKRSAQYVFVPPLFDWRKKEQKREMGLD